MFSFGKVKAVELCASEGRGSLRSAALIAALLVQKSCQRLTGKTRGRWSILIYLFFFVSSNIPELNICILSK